MGVRVDHRHAGRLGVLQPGQQDSGLVQADDPFDQLLRAQVPAPDQREHRGIVGRRHAVAAEQVQFPRDDAGHGQPGIARHRRKQSHLHVPASAPQAHDRVRAGLLAADGVHGNVAAAAGDLVDAGRNAAVGGAIAGQNVAGAERVRRLQGGGVAVDGDHVGAEGPGDHHHAQADAARSDHRHPLARRQPRPARQRPVGGGEAAAQRRGGRERDLGGDRDQVGVGGMQRNVLRERAPVRETGLLLGRAHLRVTGKAPFARAAAADERHRDPVADRPFPYPGADRRDLPGQLMTRHMRQRDVFMPSPRVPVASAQPRSTDPHHYPTRGRGRIGYLSYL
jgi:hypothetical protein